MLLRFKMSIFIILVDIIKIILTLIPILIGVGFLTLLERKFIGYSQNRKGPNKIGIYGLLQPLSDGIKLFIKEPKLPSQINLALYILSPFISLLMALIIWIVIPLGKFSSIIDFKYSLLLILTFGTIGVYSIILSGWSSNSKYSFFGSIRATAQLISYEIVLGLVILFFISISSKFNLFSLVLVQTESVWFWVSLFPIMIIFFISSIAEINRAPFDLTEGESELVSGFNLEYSGFNFAFFFLAEYSHIIFFSFFFSILFLGGWVLYFSNLLILTIKAILIMVSFVWIRASFPRFRFDHLMYLIWKTFLPLVLVGFFILIIFLI